MADMKLWSSTEFDGREKKVKKLIKELKNLKRNYDHSVNRDRIRGMENHIDNLLADDEVYWKQRSRVDRLLAGDKNMKFFHAKASARKQKNKIWGVLNEDGNWTKEAEEIESKFCDHFASLFTTTRPSRQQREAAVESVPRRVTAEMNEELTRPFTKEEIKEALFQMCPTKAPGPDGLPAAFFQKHWEFVGEGVTATCLQILNDREAFSSMLILAEKKKHFQGLKFNKELFINNLLFADDSLIFSRAAVEDCKKLKQIFDCYAAASGQIFNFEKSSMLFSGNVSARQINEIKDIFQLKVVSKHEKYLGLPSMVGRKKVGFFKEIKLRILSKISGWQSKYFSSGGSEKYPLDKVGESLSRKGQDTLRAVNSYKPSWDQNHHSFGGAYFGGDKSSKNEGDGELDQGIRLSGQWNVIWAMELPEKIKIFMWRAVKNLLPTAENLWKMRVLQDPICSRCKMKAENIIHAILECKPARQMWKLTPYYAEMNVLINQDLLSMMKELEKSKSKEELQRIIALCWAAWYSRNRSIFENVEQDPHITVAKADATVEAYARVKMGKILAAASNTPEKSSSWLPPPQGLFKANVDAAINEEKRKAGLGVVIRDSNGEVIAAAVNRTPFYGNVAQAEAAAVNFGIQIAMEADLLPLTVETDCKEVFDFVFHKQSSRTEIF
ncbi:rnase h domain-containing protein [Citrus sinensis]|nr:rnase h domain-containing protein [Citrus sinensis]